MRRKLTDKKIDEMISRTPEDTEVSEEFEERVQKLLNNLVKDDAYPFPPRRMPVRAASIVLCVVLLSTVSVGAAISKMQERMEAMPDSEIAKNVSELEGAYQHADSFSRELTKQEKEQLRSLAAEYEQGQRFPEGELVMADSAADIQPGRIGFAAADSTFILPDAPLTEEEMLQMIDFYYKRDYSLYKTNVAKEDEPQTQTSILTEDKALQLAQNLVESVAGLDLEECETIITDLEDDIHIEFVQKEKSYKVLVNKESEKVTEFEFDHDVMQVSDMPVDESLYKKKYEEISKFLVDQIGLTEPFASAFCIYGERQEDGTLAGSIDYYFEIDNSYYKIGYDIKRDQIVTMGISAIDAFDGIYEINYEQALKAGVQYKRIDLFTSNTKDNQEELK